MKWKGSLNKYVIAQFFKNSLETVEKSWNLYFYGFSRSLNSWFSTNQKQQKYIILTFSTVSYVIRRKSGLFSSTDKPSKRSLIVCGFIKISKSYWCYKTQNELLFRNQRLRMSPCTPKAGFLSPIVKLGRLQWLDSIKQLKY